MTAQDWRTSAAPDSQASVGLCRSVSTGDAVLPDAQAFLSLNPEERAERRLKEKSRHHLQNGKMTGVFR